jgi:hypothetical protein
MYDESMKSGQIHKERPITKLGKIEKNYSQVCDERVHI